MSEEETRRLHRLIDRRVDLRMPPQSLELVRGIVTAVHPQSRTCEALIDAGATPTPGIAIPAGVMPIVGDDLVIARRDDGFLLMLAALRRDHLVTGSILPAVDAGSGQLDPITLGSEDARFQQAHVANIQMDFRETATNAVPTALHHFRRAYGDGAELEVPNGGASLGSIRWSAWDGEKYIRAAQFWAGVDIGASPGVDDVPGAFYWLTRNDAELEVIQMVLDPEGQLQLTEGQIQFPTPQVPSSGTSVLDDYDEGTWTPEVTFETPGNLTVGYRHLVAYYTKVGRVVHITAWIDTDGFAHTTASGYFAVTGLPFNPISSTTGSLMHHLWPNTGAVPVVPYIRGLGWIEFYQLGTGSWTQVVVADVPTGQDFILRINATYMTT
jgi:hypothetical protein